MKIRNGFVSNSSSSSFVLGKAHLSEEQILMFQEEMDSINDDNGGEGCVFETKYYFHGEVSHHNEVLNRVIEDIGIGEYCSFEC